MACELNPAMLDDLAQAISAAAMPYFFAGLFAGAAFLFLVAVTYNIYKGE